MTTTVKRNGVKIVSVLLIALLCLTLAGCGHTLSGKYKARGGRYEVKFEKNGECTWYQDGTFFEGTYEWDENKKAYILEIEGNGFYLSTVFEAKPLNDTLMIKGGVVDDQFVKE